MGYSQSLNGTAFCVTGPSTKTSEADLVIGDGVKEWVGELDWVW